MPGRTGRKCQCCGREAWLLPVYVVIRWTNWTEAYRSWLCRSCVLVARDGWRTADSEPMTFSPELAVEPADGGDGG